MAGRRLCLHRIEVRRLGYRAPRLNGCSLVARENLQNFLPQGLVEFCTIKHDRFVNHVINGYEMFVMANAALLPASRRCETQNALNRSWRFGV